MRFTIRDLLWLTAVVALGVAWWVDRSRQGELLQAANGRTAALEEMLIREGFAIEWRDDRVTATPFKGSQYRFQTDPKIVDEYRRSRMSMDSQSPNPSAPAPNPADDNETSP